MRRHHQQAFEDAFMIEHCELVAIALSSRLIALSEPCLPRCSFADGVGRCQSDMAESVAF